MYLSFHNSSWADKSDSSSTTTADMETVDDSRSNNDSGGVSPSEENNTENNNNLSRENASSAFTMDDNLQPDNELSLLRDKSKIGDSSQQDNSGNTRSQDDNDGNHDAFSESQLSVEKDEMDIIESTIPSELTEVDATRSQGDNDGNHDAFNESELSVKNVKLDVIENTVPQEVAETGRDQQDDHVDGEELEEMSAINFKSEDTNEESEGTDIIDNMSNNDIDTDQANDKDDIKSDTIIHNDLSDPSQIVKETRNLDPSVGKGSDNEASFTQETLQDDNNGTDIRQSTDQLEDHVMQDSINEFSNKENIVTKDAITEHYEEKHDETVTVETVEIDDKSDNLNWVDVVGSDQLRKATLMAGSGVRPQKGQFVTIKYSMHLSNSIVVLHDVESQFILGEGEVVPALDLVVALMNVGETVCVFANSRYGYAQYGSLKYNVPQGADLEFEITLVDVTDGPNFDNMLEDERINLGNRRRQYGNELFQDKNYYAAVSCYTKALNVVEPSVVIAKPSEELQSIRAKCWNNLAAAQLKIEAYDAAAKSCKNVLMIQQNNVKAWFRQAKIYAAKGDLEKALDSMKKASSLDPSNKLISDEYAALRQKVSYDLKKEKEMYKRMVGGTDGVTRQEDTLMSNVLSSPWKIAIGASVVAVTGVLAMYLLSRR